MADRRAAGFREERVEPARTPGVDGPRAWLRRALRVVRQVFGAPDYAAYLEHCATAGHAPRLNEREYVSEFFAAKGKVVRCC